MHLCSIEQKYRESIAILLVLWYQKVSKHTRYQYREILVLRYIEVSSVSPIPTVWSVWKVLA